MKAKGFLLLTIICNFTKGNAESQQRWEIDKFPPLLGSGFPYLKIEKKMKKSAKECNVVFFYVLCKRTKHSTFLRSFPFCAKERCVLFHSLQKNVVFFSVLYKRTLRSFPFFRKERKRTERSFGSHFLNPGSGSA